MLYRCSVNPEIVEVVRLSLSLRYPFLSVVAELVDAVSAVIWPFVPLYFGEVPPLFACRATERA